MERLRSDRRRCGGKAAVAMKVERRPAGVRQRPGAFASPLSAMLQPAIAVAPARTTAHHKNADRRLVIDTVALRLDPAVEPAPAQREKIFRQIAVDSRRRA